MLKFILTRVYSLFYTGKIAMEKKGEFLCPLSWSVPYNFAHNGYIEFTEFLNPRKIFSMETKYSMVHSAL